MIRHRGRRRILLAVIVALGAVLSGALGISALDRDPEPAQGSAPMVIVLAGDDLDDFAHFDVVADAHAVATLEQADAMTRESRALVFVDAAFAAKLNPGDLQAIASNGSAIVGLNVPLARLNDLAGFQDELKSINPRFAEHPPEGDRPARPGPFYSLVWRTPPGANPSQWGRLQHSLSDGLFDVVTRHHKNLVQGLITDEDGVIPLEEYGR
jgi:hypothetical protein